MSSANRRGFLKIAGAGAAAVGATSLVGASTGTTVAGAAVAAVPAADTLPAGASGSLVAYVQDVSSGQVSLMVEGHEVTVTDHALVAKLAKALHSSSKV